MLAHKNIVCKYLLLFAIFNGPGWLSRYSGSLRAGRSGDRIQVGVNFLAPVQTGPGAHSARCTMVPGHFEGYKDRGVALSTCPRG